MAIPAFLIPILTKGLDLIANAALAKGKDWVKDKTGVDLDTPELTSEDYVKLKQYEMEHQEELLKLRQEDDKLDAEMVKAYLADVQNARGLQMTALSQEDLFSKRFLYYFAIYWSVVCSVYIGFITFGHIPDANVRFADTILGFLLGTLVAQIFNFFFGSSVGSKKSGDVIREVVQNVTRR
jgi:hypothetical protein